MNLGFRLYDPVIGRFLSVDPLFEMQIGINPYHYCYNDPVNGKDPSGLCSDCGEDCVIGPFYGNVNGGDNKKQSSVPGSWVDSELSANDYAIYGIKNKFNSHSADQLLVSHNGQNATTDIRILIPSGKEPIYEADERSLKVPGKIQNASTFVMSQEIYDSYNKLQNEGVSFKYEQLQSEQGLCFEVTNNFHLMVGEFDLIPNVYEHDWETPFISDGITAEFGISNRDSQNPNCSKSMNILLSMNCSVLYAAHSHCDGNAGRRYQKNQATPTYPQDLSVISDGNTLNTAQIGVVMRPITVGFYNYFGSIVINKSYIMR